MWIDVFDMFSELTHVILMKYSECVIIAMEVEVLQRGLICQKVPCIDWLLGGYGRAHCCSMCMLVVDTII